jgi:hypothetical protein
VLLVGIVWAERHQEVCVMAADGRVLVRVRITAGVAGVARLHELIARHADAPTEVVVGIQTDRGLLAGALVAAGYQVVAVNPLASRIARAIVVLVGQRCLQVKAQGERSWPSVRSPPKAAPGANLFRRSALTVARGGRRRPAGMAARSPDGEGVGAGAGGGQLDLAEREPRLTGPPDRDHLATGGRPGQHN